MFTVVERPDHHVSCTFAVANQGKKPGMRMLEAVATDPLPCKDMTPTSLRCSQLTTAQNAGNSARDWMYKKPFAQAIVTRSRLRYFGFWAYTTPGADAPSPVPTFSKPCWECTYRYCPSEATATCRTSRSSPMCQCSWCGRTTGKGNRLRVWLTFNEATADATAVAERGGGRAGGRCHLPADA